MHETTGVVENGLIHIEAPVNIPDGTQVTVTWDERIKSDTPLERLPLTAKEMDADIRIARTGLQTSDWLTEENGIPVFRVSPNTRPITLDDVSHS